MADPLPAPEPIARSPISPAGPFRRAVVAGWEVIALSEPAGPAAAALTLTDASPVAKVAVRALPDAGMARVLGVPFGQAARESPAARFISPAALVIGSAPGEWLVLGPPGSASTIAAGVTGLVPRESGDELVTVVDLTHGIALLRLTGRRAAATLAGLCGIDLGDRHTPPGAAFSSLVAGVVTGVVRDDVADRPGSVPSYLLHCERSYGQYLFDVLLDAGAEFGIGVGGFRLAGI